MLTSIFMALAILPPGTTGLSLPILAVPCSWDLTKECIEFPTTRQRFAQESAPAVTVSFSSQGAEALKAMTGKKIRGVGLTAVTVCSTDIAHVPVGTVFQNAISHGISPIDPDIAIAMVNRKVGFSIYHILPHIVSDGAAGVAVLMAGRVISATNPWLVGLISLAEVGKIAQQQFESHAPDPAPLFKSLLDPNASMDFSGKACHRGMMVTRYKGKQSDKADGTYSL